jgi:hypothetical protein
MSWSPVKFFRDSSTFFLRFDPNEPNTIYAGKSVYEIPGLLPPEPFSSGIYKSTDLGNNWTFLSTGIVSEFNGLEFDPIDRTMFAVGPNRVSMSKNGGFDWHPYSAGLDGVGVIEIKSDRAGEFMYAATSTGVYRLRRRVVDPNSDLAKTP